MITTCTTCGRCYEAGSEEQANEPTRFCPACKPKPATHSPAPWHVEHIPERPDAPLRVESADGWRVAQCNRISLGLDEATCRANARLVAAAPDLLTACRLALPIMREFREAIFASNQIDDVVRDTVEKAAIDEIDAVILLAGNAVANAEGGGS